MALHLDLESRSEIDLKQQGLDIYSSHPSTEIISAAWAWDDNEVERWDISQSPLPPRELREAMEDPEVERYAFNMQFERVMCKRVLGWDVPYENSKCTMALANMHSFTGTLEQIGIEMGLPAEYLKNEHGSRLINKFCKPQKITQSNSIVWRDALSDPDDWELFVAVYNPQDVVAERAMKKRLIKFPLLDSEWDLYYLDQEINDHGFPIDREFVANAMWMAAQRKDELISQMREITELANPNSPKQFVPWLQLRGYPFSDLKKDTVSKVISEHEEQVRQYENEQGRFAYGEGGFLDEDCLDALKLRQWAARTSTRKYTALTKALAADDYFRFGFQYGGAARTLRFSGRRFQAHNLPRPPKSIEPDAKLAAELGIAKDHYLAEVTALIKAGDYEALSIQMKEPMEGLVGTLRSCIRVHDEENEQLTVADLSSIETVVSAWVTQCQRLLRVIKEKKDPYIDFGTFMFSKAYEDVTKRERQESKPAVLGCCYRLGGGDLRDGKRTGLWGYAESMGVNLSRDACHKAVLVYRSNYPEIPEAWYALERAIKWTIRSGQETIPTFRRDDGSPVKMPVTITYKKPYLLIRLPSGRHLFYHLPRIEWKTMYGRDGEPYDKEIVSHMGQNQVTKKWGRVQSHGGKFFENIVQAIARDILKAGLLRVAAAGFKIVLHVHDEIATITKRGDNYLTLQLLIDLMTQPVEGHDGLPLNADGYQKPFYRKDG